jgi:perosamine synthetase
LKYRAHPLALALALPQIKAVDQLLQDRHQAAAGQIDAQTSIPGIELVRSTLPGIMHGNYALVALIDPEKCGFDRGAFTAAMHAASRRPR